MTTLMYGYDVILQGRVILIQPGHMVEFAHRCISPLESAQARRSVKADFEEGFDKVAQFVLQMEDLPEGDLQLQVAGMDGYWQYYFLDAILRAFKAQGEQTRKVVLSGDTGMTVG
jgi:hypothetical protein